MFIFNLNYLIYECLKEEKNRDYIHQMINDKLNEHRIIKSFEWKKWCHVMCITNTVSNRINEIDEQYKLKDSNLRDKLFIKCNYRTLWFDMNEFICQYEKKEMKYKKIFETTKTTYDLTTSEYDKLINDDPCT